MITLSAQQASEILNAEYCGADVSFTGVSIDSRTITAGNLFFAIKGFQLDGHDYLQTAKAAGAVAAVVDHKVDLDIPQIIVADTTLAMGQLAHYWRKQFAIPIVGITGSCGKTTTTRMIAAVLQQQGKTLYPEGNKNNQWGVPLTLFKLSDQYDFAVIEIGANNMGEINYLANIVRASVAVLTNVAPVHLSVSEGIGFGTIDGVFNEKSEIFRALDSAGIAIVNAEDAYFPQWQKMLAKQSCLTFGYNDSADISASHLQVNQQFQYSFDMHTPNGDVTINLSSLGKHNVLNALAASAVGIALGLSLLQIQHGLAEVETVSRRLITHKLANGAVVIDDSYNSNVTSAKAVLEMLAEFKGKKIAVLGDMAEIGSQSAEFHHQVGQHAQQLGIDYLFAFGPEAIAMAEGFGDNAFHYTQVAPLVTALQNLLDKEVLVVVKGSLSTGMDRIVNAITTKGV